MAVGTVASYGYEAGNPAYHTGMDFSADELEETTDQVRQGGCSCWVGLTKYAAGVPAVGIALLTNQDVVDPDPTAHTILEQIVALG